MTDEEGHPHDRDAQRPEPGSHQLSAEAEVGGHEVETRHTTDNIGAGAAAAATPHHAQATVTHADAASSPPSHPPSDSQDRQFENGASSGADPAAAPTGGEHRPVPTAIPSVAANSSPNTPSIHAPAPESEATVNNFVSPATYLKRARATSRAMKQPPAETALDRDQRRGLERIREFLKARTSYDVLPLSFRLIVLDTSLLVKKSIAILNNNGIVSAPLWDSKTSTFAGLLTTSDFINVIQYYAQNPAAMGQIDQFRLDSLREIEKAINVQPPETISISPTKPLYTACRRMLETRARRIPLIDVDGETKRAMVASVITQYRILKFISVNVTETQLLRKSLRSLGIGTWKHLIYAAMDTPVIEVIGAMSKHAISCVPILNTAGVVINVFEAVDVIALIKGGNYDGLSLTVGEALLKRSEDFPGIYTCSPDDRLDSVFDTFRKSRVHRFVIIDKESRLKGVLSLSDILEYILLEGEERDGTT